MRILAAGTSGFLGTALRARLAELGHQVTQLVRSEPREPDQVRWDPYRGELDHDVVEASDVIVNLAGAPIARWPWTAAYRRTLLESRVATTATIADTIARVDRRPDLVNASGIDYYGHDDPSSGVVKTEDSPSGETFLAEVCREWEAATQTATDAGARVAIARTSIVLGADSPVVKLIRLPFLCGVGGKVGSGEQYFPTVSLADYLHIVTRLITDDATSGPYNVAAPVEATNAEFAEAMGTILHRPTFVRVPSCVVRAAAGGLGDLPLGSNRVRPARLLEAGYEFVHPTIDDQVGAALG